MAEDTINIAQRIELAMGPDFQQKLSSFNPALPMVQFQLETTKINATFSTVFELLGSMQGVVSDVCASVNRHDSAIDTLRKELDALKKAVEDDPRIHQLQGAVRECQSKIDVVDKKLATTGGKVEAMDIRVKALENKKVDFGPLERELLALKKELSAVNEHTEALVTKTDAHSREIDSCVTKVEELRNEDRPKLNALYTIFEMNPREAVALANDPKSAERAHPKGNPRISRLTEYCHGLPSFATLKSELNTAIQSGLDGLRRKQAEDFSTLNGRLMDKADRADYEALNRRVDEINRTTNQTKERLELLSKEVDQKMNAEKCEKELARLETVKADRGELIDFLRRGDLGGVEDEINALRRAIDELASKTNLDLMDMRRAAAPSVESRTSIATDPNLVSRVDSLERDTRDLYEVKADKKAMADVYQYVDNAVSNLQSRSRPSTPLQQPINPAVPTEALRHGALQPLTRPPSAGREARATIPETIRPPSPNLAYTSSPIKYVPNNAKYRATASLFDSSGQRTNVTVTAARAVPHVEHVTNMANVAAGTEVTPDDHAVHEIPNDVGRGRPGSGGTHSGGTRTRPTSAERPMSSGGKRPASLPPMASPAPAAPVAEVA